MDQAFVGALGIVAGLHLGFQATVTLVVYPALAAEPGDHWTAAHRAHTRRITPIVALVYAAVLALVAWAPAAGASPLAWVALVAHGAAMVVTAVAAAPLHGRLAGPAPDALLVRRLLAVDRLRLAAVVVAAAASAVVVLG